MKLIYILSFMSLLGVFLVNSQAPSALPHRVACHRYYERHKQNLPQPYAGMILSQFVQTCIDRGGPSKLAQAAPAQAPTATALPPGDYQNSCHQCLFTNNTLKCRCETGTFANVYKPTQVTLTQQDLQNIQKSAPLTQGHGWFLENENGTLKLEQGWKCSGTAGISTKQCQ